MKMLLILKTLGMRALSWSFAAWLSPIGKLLLVAAVAGGAYWLWEARIERRGAERERAKWEEASREGQVKAIADRAIASRWIEDQSMRDAQELAREEAEEERVRNDNPGDSVLWPAGDDWLQSKRGKGRASPAGRRSGGDPLPGASGQRFADAPAGACAASIGRHHQNRCAGVDRQAGRASAR